VVVNFRVARVRSTEYWTEKEAVSTSVHMSFKNMTSLFELTVSMKTHFKAIMWFCCDDSFVNDEHQLCASRLCARGCDISFLYGAELGHML